MQENRNDSELGLVVTSPRRDGRRRYDSQSKRRLAQACLQSGVSLAGRALKHGVNANNALTFVQEAQAIYDATGQPALHVFVHFGGSVLTKSDVPVLAQRIADLASAIIPRQTNRV